jgi:hypothetical protein
MQIDNKDDNDIDMGYSIKIRYIEVNTLNTQDLNSYQEWYKKNKGCESFRLIVYPQSPTERSYIFIAVDDNNDIMALSNVIMDLTKKSAAIYNNCTSIKYRRQGVMKKLLVFILKKIISNNAKFYANIQKVWLGVKLDNPQYLGASKVNLKAGFDEVLLNNTDILGNIYQFPFLSMIYNVPKIYIPLEEKAVEVAFNKIKLLQEEYITIFNFGCINYQVSVKDCDILFRYRDDNPNSEIGGYFDDISDIKNYMNNYINILKLNNHLYKNIDTIDNTPQCSVDSPSVYAPVYFHTHPINCYYAGNCEVGWPSAPDIALLCKMSIHWKRQVVSLIVTHEGMYSVQLSIDFFKYFTNYDRLYYNTAEQLKIIEEIDAHVQTTYQNRCHNSVITAEERVKNYVNFLNNIVTMKPPYKFTVFNAKFRPWYDIKNRGFNIKIGKC